MKTLTSSYSDNVAFLDGLLAVEQNFDIIKKPLAVGTDELTFYYIDGFVKDAVMQKLMLTLSSLNGIAPDAKEGEEAASQFMRSHIAYVETDLCESVDDMVAMVLSGATLMVGSRMGRFAVIIDSRSYPARSTEEPQNDRVMRGSRDGFVETLISNTALIRRRIRDTTLTMRHIRVGIESKSDLVLCFMSDRADEKFVSSISSKLRSLKVGTLTMGHQSLIEALVDRGYLNPFPKVRLTERPDVAAAQLYEGSVLILIDNTPEVMVLPTSIFDFMQETNDFYFPPLTGTYLRIVRQIIFFLTLYLIPVWYLLVRNVSILPDWLTFIAPKEIGQIPIILQLLLVEFIVDGLKMASMNTPDMLSNSLSVVGGLILGDFAISLGWLIPEVILLEAFVAIANFSQRSYELGYAFKFMRILLLILSALFGIWGFFGGVALMLILLCTTRTLNGNCTYLYPLIPFDKQGFLSVFFRIRKKDLGGSKK